MKNLKILKEYVTKRNQAFESKILETKNPLPKSHFCNNQKYLDAFSQDIIHGNRVLENEEASIDEILYNTLAHRIILDKEFCKNFSDDNGVIRLKDHDKIAKEMNEMKSFKGRYRTMMSNVHLTKYSKEDFYKAMVDSILPNLYQFKNCNQSDIWNADKLGYQCGDFTQYQISSDLLYIDQLNISPDKVDYYRLGTQRGMDYITGKHEYDEAVIDLILEYNKEYDHKTEFTKYMIPSDANNVLCEFYKYTVSKKTRYRKPEVITHKENEYEIPKSIRKYKDENN